MFKNFVNERTTIFPTHLYDKINGNLEKLVEDDGNFVDSEFGEAKSIGTAE